ncbi:hypothetical protein OTK49_03515 [Vibrio coralliirubri]|uniref:hypothetical protein n=1 Tax=Vibrio coralliirubri TaxID=1516159 RepID=UPI002283B204|nr:hypothetical protein [Vibrio coralliirubri]MCY9861586.1 hypothetical protein [Vibrio coralliirubri]
MNTLHNCNEQSIKFDSIDAWMSGEPISYEIAKAEGILVDCCGHMTKRQKWNLDSCKEDARPYTRKTAWQIKSRLACTIARENGWHEECTKHMSAKLWNFESCFADAQNYSTRTEWMHKSSTAYHTARQEGWLDECCAHMTAAKRGKTPKWTFDECMKSSAGYDTPNAWQVGAPSAYQAALRKNDAYGWKDKCIAHMKSSTNSKPTNARLAA